MAASQSAQNKLNDRLLPDKQAFLQFWWGSVQGWAAGRHVATWIATTGLLRDTETWWKVTFLTFPLHEMGKMKSYACKN